MGLASILGSGYAYYHIQWHRGTQCDQLYGYMQYTYTCEPMFGFYALDGDVFVPVNSSSISVGSSPYTNTYCTDAGCEVIANELFLVPGCNVFDPVLLLGAQSGKLYEIQSIYFSTS